METMTYQAEDDWIGDPHSGNQAVHYRLYAAPNGVAVICVQNFDYFDYDARLILSPHAWDSEDDAERALMELLPAVKAADDLLPAALDPDMRMRMLARSVREFAAAP